MAVGKSIPSCPEEHYDGLKCKLAVAVVVAVAVTASLSELFHLIWTDSQRLSYANRDH